MAARIKYRYNPDTCKYEPWYLQGKALRNRILIFLGISFMVGCATYFWYRHNYSSFEEQYLTEENNSLQVEWSILEQRIKNTQVQLLSFVEKDDKNYRVILDAQPLSTTEREAGVGGSEKFNLREIKDFPKVLRGYQQIEKLKHQLTVELQSFSELKRLTEYRINMWASRPAIQPINNKQLNRLHLTYGTRFHPIFNVYQDHKGLDFAAERGTPVYATGDGKITMTYFSGSYGNVIYLNHGHDFETRYAHLSGFNVVPGQRVKRGQVIGFVGNTGNSVSSHLHYEVLYKDQHVNPINFFQQDLSNKEYEKLIEVGRKQQNTLD
ncbi:MAG: M23 family metallopeptidase [Cyclobacteriaceae bacterium]|nr:M23 family metallopeptidase [Cyclobacteriaceae bacterium]